MKTIENRYLLVMLITLLAVGQMAQTIYVPAMPTIAAAFHISDGMVQQVMAAYLMTYGASQLFYGPLSDSIGRRPVILLGMAVFIMGSVTALQASSLNALVLGAAIQEWAPAWPASWRVPCRAISMAAARCVMPTAC